MLNYIRSENYHNRRNKGFLVCVAIFAGLMAAAIVFLRYFSARMGEELYAPLHVISTSMSVIFAAVFAVAGFLENNDYQRMHTLKNSVAFGFPRPKIYVGKFISQLLACTIIYLALPLLYIGLVCVLLKVPSADEFTTLFRTLAGGYPLCVCALSVCFCFFTNMGGGWGGALSAFGILYIIPRIIQILSVKYTFLSVIYKWSPVNMLSFQLDKNGMRYAFWDSASGMAHCYLTGILGILLFIGIGIVWMEKREIR